MKLYFETLDSEHCFSLEDIKDKMRADNIKTQTVYRAEIDKTVPDFFWCGAMGEVGEKGNCGKQCEDYKPRNGKSGCCKHWGYLYNPNENKELIINLLEEKEETK